MKDNERINELRRTQTWIRKTIKHLDSGRVDLAKELLAGKITELEKLRLALSMHKQMVKRERMRIVRK